MRAVDIIRRKRLGEELSPDELRSFVEGFVAGTIPDYQAAALLMAICFQGMTFDETATLTQVMAESGQTLDLGPLADRVVDKHSTGGVGDKTSLVLVPLVAAAGVPVAKLSGRGLGFSGGTLDKLESIPGFRVDLSADEFRHLLAVNGLVIAGQSAELAPADAKLYALRDVTATVDCIPLIASSILSKKFAAGAQRIVLDVKVGSGAFVKTIDEAVTLGQTMIAIGRRLGRQVAAVVSDMSQPLGQAVGNALEVREAIETLRGGGPPDLWELCLTLGAHALQLAGAYPDLANGRRALAEARDSGAALAKLATMIRAQGGDPNALTDPAVLPWAPVVGTVLAPRDGYVAAIDAEAIGHIVVALGAGRARKGEPVDPSVGIVLHRKVGDAVVAGDPLVTVHAANEAAFTEAADRVLLAYRWSAAPVQPPPVLHRVLN